MKYTSCVLINVPNVGDSILFRGVTEEFGISDLACFTFRMTGGFEASGNIMSLVNFAEEIPSNYCFARLFLNCTSLTVGPETPALNMTEACYQSLYNGCTNLTTIHELPAETLAKSCYTSIFKSCNKLTRVEVAFHAWDTTCTTSWFDSVTNKTGTFVINSPTLPADFGTSKIPTGWTVIRQS